MKTVAAILTICVMLLLGFMGCSKEESPAPPPKGAQKIKIVKPPKQQEPERQKAQIPGEQEKEEILLKEAEEGKAADVAEIPKKEPEQLKRPIIKQIPNKQIEAVRPAEVDEKPAQEVAKEEGAAERKAEKLKTALAKKIPKKQIEPVKPIGREEKPAQMPEKGVVAKKAEEITAKPAGVEDKPAQRPETGTEEKETEEEEMEAYYIVKKGESLYDVASREDVFGNKLKWPILYQLNIDTLANLKTEGDVVERALPEHLKLRILNPDTVEENLEKRSNRRWAINVLSTTTNEKVVPITMTLIRNGHSAYLTSATVKGKDWTRLRVGFFTSKAEADAQGKKIRDLLHISDLWSVKLGPMEFAEFAGY